MTDEKVPVSLKLLEHKSKEIRSEITTHRVETKSDFAEVKAEIAALRTQSDARFEKMLRDAEANRAASDAKFKAMFEDMRAQSKVEFEEMRAELNIRFDKQLYDFKIISSVTQEKIDKTYAIVEEQNTRNRYAMDGYTIVYEKLQETDARLGRIEKHLFGS